MPIMDASLNRHFKIIVRKTNKPSQPQELMPTSRMGLQRREFGIYRMQQEQCLYTPNIDGLKQSIPIFGPMLFN
jgi:hypothetical protein